MFEFESQEIIFEKNYASYNRMNDVNESLDVFILSIERAIETDLAWKYAVIAAHSALQGIICIALREGNSFATWKPKDFKKWMDANENGDDIFPITHLDYFMALFDKLFSQTTEIARSDIKWLNCTRNEFTHFNTDSFSVCLRSVFLCCWEALKAIELAPKIPKLNYVRTDELQELNLRLEKSKKVMRRYQTEKAIHTANGEER